jgi:hypothetical protein
MLKKLFGFARVAIPVLALAFVTGCSQDFEGGASSNGISLNGVESRTGVNDPPLVLENTDWAGPTDVNDVSSTVVAAFRNDVINGPTVTFLAGDLSMTTYPYSYTGTGIGTIIGPTSPVAFTINNAGTVMSIATGIYTAPVTLTLLPKLTLAELDETAWNGSTPRYSYASLDFDTDVTNSVQATFGDGTFPVYALDYYDNVSAGFIEDMGFFYLRKDAKGTTTVVFPNFYQYHIGDEVVYLPSTQIIASIDGTTWMVQASPANETVIFRGNTASFTGTNPDFYASYVYDGYQAGGVNGGAGSFRIQYDGNTGQYKMLFYDFKGGGNLTFTLLQP